MRSRRPARRSAGRQRSSTVTAAPVGWQRGFNQAIALKVDGIVTDADAASLQPQIKEAPTQGIVVVGIHAAALPGPQPDLGLFYNIQQDPRDIGNAQADWIIVHSDGKARVVVTSHCEFAIACTKAHADGEAHRGVPGLQGAGVLQLAHLARRRSASPPLVTAGCRNTARRSTSPPLPTTPRTSRFRRCAAAASTPRT